MAYKNYDQFIDVQPIDAGMRVGGDSDGNIVITREEDTGIKSVAYSGDTLTITDQNDSEYTATITSGGNAAIDSEGYGINIDTVGSKVIISVDTDVIADTEWVRDTGVHTSKYLKVSYHSDETPADVGNSSGAIALGTQSEATSDDSISIGTNSSASDSDTIAIGHGAQASGDKAFAMGLDAICSGDRSYALGNNAQATAFGGFAMGGNSRSFEQYAICIGSGMASGLSSACIGSQARANNENCFAFGTQSKALDSDALAVGTETMASGLRSTAVGTGAQATNIDTSAFGRGAVASGNEATAIGAGARATFPDSLAVGQGAEATNINATAIGKDAVADHINATALGDGCEAQGVDSVALGDSSTATEDYTVAIGEGCQASAEDAVAIGKAAGASGVDSIAIGHSADATHSNSIALGHSVQTDTEYQVMIGATRVDHFQVSDTDYTPTRDNDLTTKKYVDDNSIHFGYQNLFTDSTELQRYPTTHDTGHNHFASDGNDIRWYYSQETVFDTDLPIGATIEVTFVPSDPFGEHETGYYSILSLSDNSLDQLYTLNLEHIEGADPLSDNSDALDTENHYEFRFSYENRAAGRTFNGHRTGYVPIPDDRSDSLYLNATGEFTNPTPYVEINSTGSDAQAHGSDSISIGPNATDREPASPISFRINGAPSQFLSSYIYPINLVTVNGEVASPDNSYSIPAGTYNITVGGVDRTITFVGGANVLNAATNINITSSDSDLAVGNVIAFNGPNNTFNSAITFRGQAEADSELAIYGINTIYTPSFTGGTDEFIAVDAQGNWTTVEGFNPNTNRIAIGNGAAADTDYAIAIGVDAIARGDGTILLGQGVTAHQDSETLSINITAVSVDVTGQTNYDSATINGQPASASNSHTFPSGAAIDFDNGGDNIQVILTEDWTIDSESGNFTSQFASSLVQGPAVKEIVQLANYKHAVGINANADTDSELVIGKVNTIRTPDFTGGSNQYIAVDSNGVWTTETVDAGGISSDDFIAGNNITIADSDSKVKISTSIDGGADNILVRNRQDDGDPAYIDVLLTSGGSQIGSIERIITPDFGLILNAGATHSVDVDTDVIADTEWVKENFSSGSHRSVYVEADNGDRSPLVYIKHNTDDTVQIHTVDSEYASNNTGQVEAAIYTSSNQLTLDVVGQNQSIPFDTEGADVYVVTDTYTAIISGPPNNSGNDPVDNRTFFEWDSPTIIGRDNDFRGKTVTNHTLSSVHTGKLGFTMADTDWIKDAYTGGDGINISSSQEVEVDDGFGLNFDSSRELQVDTAQIATHSYVQSAVRNATRGEIGNKTDEHTLYLADTEHDQLRFLQDAGVTNNRSFIVNTRGDTVYQGIAANDDDLRVVQVTDGGTETVNANASHNWRAVQYGVYEGNRWDESDAFTYNSQAFRYDGDAPTRVWNSQESTFSNVSFFRNGHNSSSLYQVTARVQLIVVDELEQIRLHDGPQLVAQSDEFEIDLTNGQTQATESPIRLAAVDSDHGTTINPGQYLAVRWAIHIDHYDDTGVSLTDAPYLVWSGTSGTQTHHTGRADVRTVTYEAYLDPADGQFKYGNNTRTPELIRTIIDTDGYITSDAQPFFKVHGDTGNPASVTNNTGAIAIGEGATVESHNDAIAIGRGATVDKFHQMRIARINEVLMDSTYSTDSDYALATNKFVRDHSTTEIGTGNLTSQNGIRMTNIADVEVSAFNANSKININIEVDTEVIADTDWVKANFEPIDGFNPNTPANSQRAARKLFREIAELESGNYTRLQWDTDNGGYQLWYDTEYTDSVDATHYVDIDRSADDQVQWRLYTGGNDSGTHLATKRKFTATDSVGAVFDYIEPI